MIPDYIIDDITDDEEINENTEYVTDEEFGDIYSEAMKAAREELERCIAEADAEEAAGKPNLWDVMMSLETEKERNEFFNEHFGKHGGLYIADEIIYE